MNGLLKNYAPYGFGRLEDVIGHDPRARDPDPHHWPPQVARVRDERLGRDYKVSAEGRGPGHGPGWGLNR